METIETIEYRKHKIEIHLSDAENPREWDNLGTMIGWSNRHTIGDKHNFNSPEDAREYFKENDVIVLPIYMYEHSCIALSTKSFIGRALHAEWDSGQVGYIYVEKEKVRKEWGVKRISKKLRETIISIFENEVETYSMWANGECYGYLIIDPNGNNIDSCGGFIGEYEGSGLMREAKFSIDFGIKENKKIHFERIKTWIKNHVPFEYRFQNPVLI